MNDRTQPRSRGGRIFRQLAELSPGQWTDLVRAVFELAIARRRIRSQSIKLILAGQQTAASASGPQAADYARVIDRVALAIPRAAGRVPWRADCLVQALAAQRWLARAEIHTIIRIGVCKDPGHHLMAHAWLNAADRIVTGGNIAGFELIFDQIDAFDRLTFG